jgi:hypothetical protein
MASSPSPIEYGLIVRGWATRDLGEFVHGISDVAPLAIDEPNAAQWHVAFPILSTDPVGYPAFVIEIQDPGPIRFVPGSQGLKIPPTVAGSYVVEASLKSGSVLLDGRCWYWHGHRTRVRAYRTALFALAWQHGEELR